MSQEAVRKAVIRNVKKKLDEFFPGKPVTWANVKFDPPAGLWFEIAYLPGRPEPSTLGDEGEDEVMGVAQIDVCIPVDSGEHQVFKALATLEDYFTGGRSLEYKGQTAVVTSTSRSPGYPDDGWWKTPLSIYFRASYQRPSLTT